MIKKITLISLSLTMILFIASAFILPSAIKDQLNLLDSNYGDYIFNNEYKKISVDKNKTYELFVMGNIYHTIHIKQSPDNDIHIYYSGETTKKLEFEEKSIDNKNIITIAFSKSPINPKNNFFISNMFFSGRNINFKIYVPKNINFTAKGDNIGFDDDVEFLNKESEIMVHTSNPSKENNNIYYEKAKITSFDANEVVIKKLGYMYNLITQDFAQEDISEPEFIDLKYFTKTKFKDNIRNIIEENSDLYNNNIDKAYKNCSSYVQSQMKYLEVSNMLNEYYENYKDIILEYNANNNQAVSENATVVNDNSSEIIDRYKKLLENKTTASQEIDSSKDDFISCLKDGLTTSSISKIVDIFEITK